MITTQDRQQWFLGNINGEQHLFIDGVHQYHVCQHPSCKKNRGYERALKKHGAEILARKVMKRESYRLYDRKYPFDSTAKGISLDEVQDTIGTEDLDLDAMVAKEMLERFRLELTPSETVIFDLLYTGHQPHDIAMLQGRKDSGSTRWHKHQIKKKLVVFMDSAPNA